MRPFRVTFKTDANEATIGAAAASTNEQVSVKRTHHSLSYSLTGLSYPVSKTAAATAVVKDLWL